MIACITAPLLGGIDQAFQFIQEYTGLVSPGILAVFMLGLFWKKPTNTAAIVGALASIPVALAFKFGSLPFLDQMGYTALITAVIIIGVSLAQRKGENDLKGIAVSGRTFATSAVFNVGAFAIMIILAVLYALFWN